MVGEVLGLLAGGTVIGLLGKFVAPSHRDNIPLWLTVLCGIGGILLGYWIYSFFGGRGSEGLDWVRWVVAVLTAAVLVVVASAATSRTRQDV